MPILSLSCALFGVSYLQFNMCWLSFSIEVLTCPREGAFDIVSEFLPHVAIILYRVYPHRQRFLGRVFLISCATTAIGTLCETIVTMWLFGSLWSRWNLAFKVVTPLLHVAFSAAQIHGSLVFWRMYRRQQRCIREDPETFEVQEDKIGITLGSTGVLRPPVPPKALVSVLSEA